MSTPELIDVANQLAEAICKRTCHGSTCGTCQLFQLAKGLELYAYDRLTIKETISRLTEATAKELNRANGDYDTRFKLHKEMA